MEVSMARNRKTITVEDLKVRVNNMIERSNSTPEARRALGVLLETVLMDTGNYNGFNYLAWLNGGCEQWRKDGEPSDTTPYLGDQSRVEYY